MFSSFSNSNLYAKASSYCSFVILPSVYISFKIIFCLYKAFSKFLFGSYFVGLFGIPASKAASAIFKSLTSFLKYCSDAFLIP